MYRNDESTRRIWDQLSFADVMWHSPDAVILTSADLALPGPRILYANPAFCQMTGYSVDELVGQTPRILQGAETDPSVLKALRESLKRKETFVGSTINYRKDGSPYQVEWNITHVLDETKNTEYYVSIQRVVNAESARLKHMEAILKAAPVGMMLTGPGGIIESANGIAQQAFGYAPGALIGLSVDDLLPPKIRAQHAQHRQDFAREPKTRLMMPERELMGQRQDGTLFPLEVGLAPITIDGVLHTLASVSDISERKKIEQSMAFSAQLQASLAAFSRAGLQGATIEELYQQAVELAVALFGFTSAVLIKLGELDHQDTIVAESSSNHMRWHNQLRLSSSGLAPLAIGHVEYTIEELPLTLRNTLKDWPQLTRALCVPVQEPDRCWGVLYTFYSDNESFSDSHLQGLESLINTLSSAIRRERDQQSRVQAVRLQAIAGEMADLGGWRYDSHSQVLYWSDEVCSIHETSHNSQLTIDEALSYYIPEYRERIKKAFFECIREGASFDEEAEIRTSKGNRRIVRIIGAAMDNAGKKGFSVQGALQDISNQRRVEENLAHSQRQFRQLAEAMPTIVWTADADGRLDYANRHFEKATGIHNDALPACGWLSALHPEDVERCQRVWKNAVLNQQQYHIDFRLYNKNESFYRWYRVSAVPVRDEYGDIYKWYGSALDIHDRKVLEDELTNSANALNRTLESITDGFFTLDRQWMLHYFNIEAEQLLSKPRDAVLYQVIWEVFPEIIGSQIEAELCYAMDKQITRHFEYFSKDLAMWLEMHIYPSGDGLSVYFRDVTDRKRSEEKIEFLAFHDTLTHLPNRQFFQHQLESIMEVQSDTHAYAGVMLIDLDHFKVLNDTWGHNVGDQLLKGVARRLETLAGQGLHAARLGGDEFTILLDHLPGSREEAICELVALAERIHMVLNEPYEAEALHIHRTCSIGVTLIEPCKDSSKEIMKRLDLALYDVKHRNRNAVGLFDPAMQARADLRAWLDRNIPAGIIANEFIPYYQPKINSEGRCIGAEALIRWFHPQKGLISPGDFIPIAEEIGLIGVLGKEVLRKVCVQMAEWKKRGLLEDLEVSINVSALQFQEDSFVNDVLAIINETGVDPKNIQLEVTETLFLNNLEKTVERMHLLRKHGIRFSLDDFGTGYSSLAYLKQLPIDVLKIDQSFIKNLPDDQDDAAIVRAIIALAYSLGLGVLAEGVETLEIQNFLINENCHTFQGYLYCKPLPPKEFQAFVEQKLN